MDIPKYIKQEDSLTKIINIYRYVSRPNERLLLYENIKTGCKQCFDVREVIRLKNKRLKKLTKYEYE